MKNYTTYKANQLLDDDDFLKAEQYPTNESTMFWNKLQEDNPSLAKEIGIARSVLHVLKKESFFLPEVEVKQLWKQIENINTRNDESNMYQVMVCFGAIAACLSQ